MAARLALRTRARVHRALALLLILSQLFVAHAPSSGATVVAPHPAGRLTGVAAASPPASGFPQPAPLADPPLVGAGSVLGVVLDAETDTPLPGAQVVMTGQAEQLPGGKTYLPLMLKGARFSRLAAASPLPAGPAGEILTFTAVTAANGAFSLAAPAGKYEIVFTLSNYTVDKRSLQLGANQVERVENVLLHRLDPVVKQISPAGGSVTNSLGNTSLEFPAGALGTTKEARVTYLSNDALPGTFADGSLPMGFASLEPEGVTFPPGKEVLWTVKYDGPLPVGTNTLCYWWDGREGRWKDPVPGKVVAAAGGGKALQAKVSHFSNYGHAMPGVAGSQVGGGDYVSLPNSGQGAGQQCQAGCAVNIGTGAVSERFDFAAVPAKGPWAYLSLRYSSDNDTPVVTARVQFTITQQVPARAAWRLQFEGKEYQGEGYEAKADWDTRNGLGYRAAPGMYVFDASETFYYDSGQQPSLAVKGVVDVRRGDIWPFGFNWLSTYDTLLVNTSANVTVIQPDGQYLTYTRLPTGAYKSPPEDFSRLVRNSDGTWTRTSKYGARETFNGEGRLIRVEEPNGNAHALAYESNGLTVPAGGWGLTTRLKSITDASGRSWQFSYGGDGYINRVTDPIGRVYTLAHDSAGNLTAITDPAGRASTYQYDAAHLLTRYTYPGGNTTSLAYDAQGRLTTHTDALGGVRTSTYAAGKSTETDELGHVTAFEYNAYGAVTRATDEVHTADYTLDANRQLVSVAPPTQRFGYDDRGNQTSYRSYGSLLTAFEPKYNRPVSVTDTLGNKTSYEYDSRGNLVSATDATGAVTRYEYDAAGQLTKYTDPQGSLTFERDAYGNITRAVDATGAAVQLSYDPAGNLATFTDSAGQTTRYTYDALDRLTSITDAVGRATAFEYGPNGALATLKAPGGRNIRFDYDTLGRLIKETDALGRTTTNQFDALSRFLGRVDATGQPFTNKYDAAGRLGGVDYADGKQSTYAYDTLDNLTAYANGSTQATLTYASRIPGQPDVVDTTYAGLPGVHSSVSYDYTILSEEAFPASAPTIEQGTATSPQAAAGQPDGSTEAPQAELSQAETPAPRLEDLPSFPEKPAGVSTNGCGSISANTTWTLANSPYVLDGCLANVDKGATLTIEPGVIVKFGWKWDMIRVYGRLLAQGTAAQPILFTSLDDDTGGDTNGNGNATQPVPGDWNGLNLNEGSTGNVLDHVVIRYGGADGASTALYGYLTTLTMSNSIIAQTKGHAMYFETAAPAGLTNNRFTDNTLTAGTVILNYTAPAMTLSGNVATGNGLNGLRMVGQFKGAAAWTGDPGFPFVVRDYNVQVMAGSTLTLAPGTVVKFGDNVWDSLEVWGTLVAQGTQGKPIYFTSTRDDSVGGDTNNDGDAQSPAPGQWNGIVFKDTSTGSVLDWVVVRYGGTQYDIAGVQANTKNFTVRNSTIAANRGHGIYMDGGTPPVFENNIITDNTRAAVRAYFHHTIGATIELRGNTVSGNGWNGFQVDGALTEDSSFAGQPDFPFVIPSGNLIIEAGARVTVKAGTVFKVADAFTGLHVRGALDVQGTAGQPVYFTSLKDDSIGGDTNNDGKASLPAPDDWMFMYFNNPTRPSTMTHTVVRYAGGTGWQSAVVEQNGSLTLESCTIAYTGGRGLVLDAGTAAVYDTILLGNEAGLHAASGVQPILRGMRFIDNKEYALRNDSAVVVDATGSWWGGSAGPLDASDDRGSGGWYNPDGDGDKVTDRVKYEPWQVVTGLVYGMTVATGASVQTTSYRYDKLSRLVDLAATGAGTFRYAFGYDAAGRMVSAGPASGSAGVRSAFSFGADHGLARLTATAASGAPLVDLTYTYDAAGNVKTASEGGSSTAYTYDAARQLTGVAGPDVNETYAYDAAGNRVQKGAITYTYDLGNQLVTSSDGAAYTYDGLGNLRTRTTGGQTTTYTWGADGELTRIDFPDGTYAAYAYDPTGNRVSKRDRAGVSTYYVYDDLDLVQELDAAGQVLANYIYGGTDMPLAMVRGGVTYFYVFDGLGNVAGLTDATGAWVVRYRYDPWGNVIGTSGSDPNLPNPFRFVGRQWDAESGLYYFRARYYDPGTARFLSPDPMSYDLLGNLYTYVANNPVGGSDPLGLVPTFIDNFFVRQAVEAMKMFHNVPPGNVEALKAVDTMVAYAIGMVARHVPPAQREGAMSWLGHMTKTLAARAEVSAAAAARAMTTTVVPGSLTTTLAATGVNPGFVPRVSAPVRMPPARVLLGPGGGGRAFARFALFNKPPAGMVSRFAGAALRWGGAAARVGVKIGARAIPGLNLIMWGYTAYQAYQWWKSPC